MADDFASAFSDLIPSGTADNQFSSAFADLIPKQPQQPQEPPKPTTGQALQRGLMTGATFNLYDELAGVARAGGLDPNDPDVLNAITSLMRGGYRLATGAEGAKQAYEQQAQATRAETAQMEKEHPVASTLGGVAGAVAVPIGMAARAPTLAGRLTQGAVTGGAVGALSGAGAGEGAAGRAAGAALGGVTGAALGGASVPATEAIMRGGAAVARPVTGAIRGAIGGVRSPEQEAARRVAGAISTDVAGGRPGLTAAEVAINEPARVMDMGDENVRALARAAANLSPEARATITNAVQDRYTSQAERVSDWFRQNFHYPDAAAQQEAIDAAAKATNDVAYRVARQQGDKPIWSPGLEQLTSSPDVVAAMRTAVERGKSRAVTEGYGGFRPGVTIEPGGQVTFQRGPTGQPAYPNLAFWDQTKRALDDEISAAVRAGRKDQAGVLTGLSQMLRAELDQVVPSYATARAGAASFFGAGDALDAGRKFLASKMTAEEGRKALAKMTPQEKQLFQDGFVSEYIKTLEKLPDRANVIDRINNSPAARSKLEVAIGREKWQELEARLRIEDVMDRARKALGNSTTARQLVELGLAGAGTAGFSFDPTSISSTAILAAALSFGHRRIDARVANKIGELLTSSDPTAVQRALVMVTKNQGLMNALRGAHRQISKIGGLEAPGVAPVQGAMQAGAGTEQPQPERVINQ